MKLETIIKSYFNSALVIDDDLDVESAFDMKKKTRTPKIRDEELDEIEFGEEEAAAAVTHLDNDVIKLSIRENHKPHEVFQNLIKSGVVTYPYKYKSKHTSFRQLKSISSLLQSSKILIVDWNMDDSPAALAMGTATLEILRRFTENVNGIKCAIIYTQEDRDSVLLSLMAGYEIIDEREGFFQNKTNENTAPSLLGFVVDKQLSPDEIFDKIGKILLKDKSTTLHFMHCANNIDNKLHNTLKKYNEPFEKVIYTQVLTSDIPNHRISNFINNTLMSDILEFDDETDVNFLFERKCKNLLNVIRLVTIEHVRSLYTLLSIGSISKNFIETKFVNPMFITELKAIFLNINLSFEEFSNDMYDLCRRHSTEPVEKKFNELVKNVILFTTLLENYLEEVCVKGITVEAFKSSFKEQSHRFTKLLKYNTDDHMGKFQTGSIYLKGQEYLLCITPVCDTYRPNNIENKMKFLVGTKISPEPKDLKNDNIKCHLSALPSNTNSIDYVKWNFYNVQTFELNVFLRKRNLKKIATMKREYVQNIVNRYIAYQARAGINELFFKESDYIENFYEIMR